MRPCLRRAQQQPSMSCVTCVPARAVNARSAAANNARGCAIHTIAFSRVCVRFRHAKQQPSTRPHTCGRAHAHRHRAQQRSTTRAAVQLGNSNRLCACVSRPSVRVRVRVESKYDRLYRHFVPR
eukprot:1374910-Pleurochrysis_carterae.AAC.1